MKERKREIQKIKNTTKSYIIFTNVEWDGESSNFIEFFIEQEIKTSLSISTKHKIREKHHQHGIDSKTKRRSQQLASTLHNPIKQRL